MTGQGRLYRDGELVGEGSPDFAVYDLSPEPARYRLELDALRGSSAHSSPEVHMVWSFRSERVPGGEAYLPLVTVRFAPHLDDHNRAPAGRYFAIPFSVSRQPGAPAVPVERVTVAASYDAGETWHPALVIRVGDVGLALVHHPDRAAAVSLRATATSEDGSSLEQIIVDGYALRE